MDDDTKNLLIGGAVALGGFLLYKMNKKLNAQPTSAAPPTTETGPASPSSGNTVSGIIDSATNALDKVGDTFGGWFGNSEGSLT